MQLSFSYFHFVMSETRDFSAAEVFDEFDTDDSSTWSDREIRTLLARMHRLPLYIETVRAFEDKIVECSKVVHVEQTVKAPAYERYLQGKR